MEKKVVIIQARMTSTRLPGKVMLPIKEKPVLLNIVERIQQATMIDEVVVATSIERSDDVIEKFCYDHNIQCFRGSLNNVLERFYYCAKKTRAGTIIRCTADNPLIDGLEMDYGVRYFLQHNLDYLAYRKELPTGMHVEVFNYASLEKAYSEATNNECLEHVTPYIVRNPQMFKTQIYCNNDYHDYSNLRFTMDTPRDYEFVRKIYDCFDSNVFSYLEIIEMLKKHPEYLEINKMCVQNELEYNGENS